MSPHLKRAKLTEMTGTPPVTGSVLPLHGFEMARLSLKSTKARHSVEYRFRFSSPVNRPDEVCLNRGAILTTQT